MKKYSILFVILFVALVAVAFKVHQNFGLNHFRNELWCDKSGYNVYLPATFIYNFDPGLFPEGIDQKLGQGFILDTLHGKVYTKYPYGVSLLQSPFWLTAHIFAGEKNGYSLLYVKSINVAAVFYLIAGCYLLFLIFCFYIQKKYAFIASLIVLFGSNLLYYGVFEPGMSHVYSFFSISLMAFALLKLNLIKELPGLKHKFQYFIILALSIALSIIIRPVNIIIWLPALILFGISNKKEFLERIRLLTNIRFIFMLLIFATILITPQLLYYQYLKGHLIINSYEFESFSNLTSPRIAELLVSPNNGFLLYTPIAIFLLVSIIYFIKRNIWISLLSVILLATDIAIYSTWWSVDLGCGYGHRPFVEMLPIVSLPVLLMLKNIRLYKIVYAVIISILIIINLKMMYSFSGCFGGDGYWDWEFFLRTLF